MKPAQHFNPTQQFNIFWPSQAEDIQFIQTVIAQTTADHDGVLPLYDADGFYLDEEEQRINIQLPLWLDQIAMDIRHRHGEVNFPFVMECALEVIKQELTEQGIDKETLADFYQLARVGLGLKLDDGRLH